MNSFYTFKLAECHHEHNAMRRNAKEIFAICCPTCGATSTGPPHNIPRLDRGVAAEDTQTVLVIDDEASDREMMSEKLRREGYRVLEANAYQDALRVFRRNGEIDLIVSDVSLPGGNGCELAMAIRKQKPDIRMLFVSGHVGAEVCRFYGLELSDLHFLRKPFSAADLLSRVRWILHSTQVCFELKAGEQPKPQMGAPR